MSDEDRYQNAIQSPDLTNNAMGPAVVLVNTDGAMSYDPPKPPTDLPTEIVDTVDDCSPELLHQVADYAAELAEYHEREDRLAEGDDETKEGDNETKRRQEDRSDDLPDDVPSKATITIKEINDNRYYYWQWRDGDRVKSKYKGPVDSTE